MKKAFTLLELIVVIVILGILATLGYTQYGKIVENMRGAEAKVNLGAIRTAYQAFYLEHGTCDGITSSDLNIGSGPNEIPNSCTSTHYYEYGWWVNPNCNLGFHARRCTSGGKNPQASRWYQWKMYYTPVTGQLSWCCTKSDWTDAWCSSSPGTCPVE